MTKSGLSSWKTLAPRFNENVLLRESEQTQNAQQTATPLSIGETYAPAGQPLFQQPIVGLQKLDKNNLTAIDRT